MKSIPAGDRADHGFAHQTIAKAADTERDRLVQKVHHRDAPRRHGGPIGLSEFIMIVDEVLPIVNGVLRRLGNAIGGCVAPFGPTSGCPLSTGDRSYRCGIFSNSRNPTPRFDAEESASRR